MKKKMRQRSISLPLQLTAYRELVNITHMLWLPKRESVDPKIRIPLIFILAPAQREMNHLHPMHLLLKKNFCCAHHKKKTNRVLTNIGVPPNKEDISSPTQS
jgi:hypothetical protein